MRVRLTSIAAGLLLAASTAGAQQFVRRLDVLSLPAWPRAAALANIGASTQLPEGALYNPALAGWSNAVAGSAHFYGSDSLFTTLVAGLTTGLVSVTASVQSLRADIGPDPLVDPLPGARLRHEHSLTHVTSVAGAMRFKGIRWGVAGKFYQMVERGEDVDGIAFDVGAQRNFGVFSVGLAAQNLGPDRSFVVRDVFPRQHLELPTRYTLAAEGVGLPMGAFVDFGALAALVVDRDGEILPAAGGQMLYTPLDGWNFAVRAGVRRPAPSSNQRPVTAGVAASLDRFTIDYAIEGVKGGDAVHRIGVRLR
jgi:hypothetical protein